MMRVCRIFFGLFLLSLLLPVSANAAVVIGQDCPTLGVSQLADNHGAIAVCLLKDPNGTSDCSNGKCLWKSSTTPNTTCPTGKVMSGVLNGEPVCKTLTCRAVYGSGSSPPHYIASATCNADEILTGMGGMAETPGSTICAGTSRGFLHAIIPTGNGVAVDAFKYNWTGDLCSRAVAICCKFQ